MALSTDLISQFVKVTKDDNKQNKATTTLYGTIRLSDEEGATPEVQLDGSSIYSPVETTVDVNNDDRVVVMIKNHKAIVTGNLTSPAAKVETVVEVREQVSTKVSTDQLNAKFATVDTLVTNNSTVKQLGVDVANVSTLVGEKATISQFETEQARVNGLLSGYEARFNNLAAADVTINGRIDATNGEILNLQSTKLDATNAAITYANIDFSNIGSAAIEKFFSKSGLIENLTVGEATVTGTLVGVTIKGDLIEGGTVIADKLVIRGEDGLYYKLNTDGVTTESEQTEYNSLNGSVITAHSITATKISVSDLVAFDATIGGFNITENSIYSGVKETIDNSTRGIHISNDGQIFLGDSDNYLKYYQDEEGNWKLEIAAESIMFGNETKSSASDIKALTEHVKIGTYTENGDTKPCVELSEGDSDFKQVITNSATMFMDGTMVRTKIDTDGVSTENATIAGEFRQGNFVWKSRSNGNLGLTWRGGNS